MKLSEVCNLVKNMKVLKDGDFDYLGLAGSKCDEKILSFIENEKYIDSLGSNIKCLITTKELGEKLKEKFAIILSKNPRVDYFRLHNELTEKASYLRAKYDTIVGQHCKISESSVISKKNVIIGNNVIIEEFVIIRENTVIGDNCVLRAGAIIGGEGYEFKRVDNRTINVVHCGGVIIENNVELQYNCTVDKALYTWDNTIVGEYSKIDNFVHIEHGVKIGKRNFIASRTTIGGRTIIGNDSWFGLGVIVSNGLILGNNTHVSLGAVVTKNIENNSKVSGNFAIEHNKFIDHIKSIR